MLIELKNSAHFGDCMSQLAWNIQVCRTSEHIIHFYVYDKYVPDLKLFVPGLEDKLVIKKLSEAPKNCFETWISEETREYPYPAEDGNVDTWYIKYFERLASKFKVINPVKTPQDYLLDTPRFLQTNNLSKHYDYLIMNYAPTSGQMTFFSKDAYADICEQLVTKGKSIITTVETGIKNIPVTSLAGLKLVDVGNIATNVDFIIASHTGAIQGVMNVYSDKAIKQRIVLNDKPYRDTYSKSKYCYNWQELYNHLGLRNTKKY
jgi:hypothetical protein